MPDNNVNFNLNGQSFSWNNLPEELNISGCDKRVREFLSIFDKDEKKNSLSKDELKEAIEFLQNNEKKISGDKANGIIDVMEAFLISNGLENENIWGFDIIHAADYLKEKIENNVIKNAITDAKETEIENVFQKEDGKFYYALKDKNNFQKFTLKELKFGDEEITDMSRHGFKTTKELSDGNYIAEKEYEIIEKDYTDKDGNSYRIYNINQKKYYARHPEKGLTLIDAGNMDDKINKNTGVLEGDKNQKKVFEDKIKVIYKDTQEVVSDPDIAAKTLGMYKEVFDGKIRGIKMPPAADIENIEEHAKALNYINPKSGRVYAWNAELNQFELTDYVEGKITGTPNEDSVIKRTTRTEWKLLSTSIINEYSYE